MHAFAWVLVRGLTKSKDLLSGSKSVPVNTELTIVNWKESRYSDADIVGLADEDNANDEYHAVVPIVDVWASYAALKDLGWTQARIGEAKGVTRTTVAARIVYSKFADSVKSAFVETQNLNEGHAREISQLSNFDNCSEWLTRELAMLHVISAILNRCKDKKPTAKQFALEVGKVNKSIDLVNAALQVLAPNWQGVLLGQLKKRNAIYASAVQKTIDDVSGWVAHVARYHAEKSQRSADRQAQAAHIHRGI